MMMPGDLAIKSRALSMECLILENAFLLPAFWQSHVMMFRGQL